MWLESLAISAAGSGTGCGTADYYRVLIEPLWDIEILPLKYSAIASLMVNAGANAFAKTPMARMPRMTITDFCNLISCLIVLLVVSGSKNLLVIKQTV